SRVADTGRAPRLIDHGGLSGIGIDARRRGIGQIAGEIQRRSAGPFAHGKSVAGAVLDVVDANAAAAPAGVADVEDAPDLSRNLRPISTQASVGAPAKSIVARGGKRRQRNAPLSGDRVQIDPAAVPV